MALGCNSGQQLILQLAGQDGMGDKILIFTQMKAKLWLQIFDGIAKMSTAMEVEVTCGSTQVGNEGNRSG